MSRTAACLCALSLFVAVGCRAPKPDFNPWAPYGSSRVPPPSTNSYGTPDNYYTQPNAGVTPLGAADERDSLSDQDGRQISLAQYTEEIVDDYSSNEETQADDSAEFTTTSASNPPRIMAADGQTNSAVQLKLRGMPVSDATARIAPPPVNSTSTDPNGIADREPAAFQPQGPVRDISQLPAASTAGAVQIKIKQPNVAPPPTSNSATVSNSSGWKSR